MGFNYLYTCPKIDKAIDEAKSTIVSCLNDYIMDLCPYIPKEKVNELSETWGNHLYNEISGAFETVRETNEDMRRDAEYQIGRLESELDDLHSEIKELERKIDTII